MKLILLSYATYQGALCLRATRETKFFLYPSSSDPPRLDPL